MNNNKVLIIGVVWLVLITLLVSYCLFNIEKNKPAASQVQLTSALADMTVHANALEKQRQEILEVAKGFQNTLQSTLSEINKIQNYAEFEAFRNGLNAKIKAAKEQTKVK